MEAAVNFVGAHYLPPFALNGVGPQTDEQLAEIAKEYVDYALNPKLLIH